MTCHSQVWQDAPILKPVHDSFEENLPLRWNRVYRIPHYVYFNHSIHVNKGVGCTTCHGAVNEMPLMWREQTFYMRECLACHREPEKYLRPVDQVFNLDWQPPADQLSLGKDLVEQYHIPKFRLTDCYTCHR
jgi:Zn ribbon nucleic-acid-binding protein